MKIGLALNARYPTEKAYGIQVDAMLRGFAEQGVEVALFYPRRTQEQPNPIPGVAFHPFGAFRLLTRPSLFSWLRVVDLLACVREMRAWQADVLLINDPVQAWLCSFFAPVYWDLHDFPNNDTWFRRACMRSLVRRVKGVVSTNTLKLKRLELLEVSLPPSIVLPNPITFSLEELDRFTRAEAREALALSQDVFLAVYIGQLFPWKGVDTVVEAAAFLPADALEIHIVGGLGEDLVRMKKLAGTTSNVRFHGQRSREEVRLWLKAADVLLVPNSGKTSLSQEDTNPMKIYEAIAAKRYLLVSDLPSIREAMSDYPLVEYVEADNVEAWKHALLQATSRSHEPIEAERVDASVSKLVLTPKERAGKLLLFWRASTPPPSAPQSPRSSAE